MAEEGLNRRIGDYILLDVIGKGGVGAVWRAKDTKLGRIVALKMIHGTSPEELARFRREARLVAILDHPNIAKVFESGGEPPFIAMQFVDGVPLNQSDRPLKTKVKALRDACNAVQYAHEQGVLHRDLKPQNILIDGSDRAFVLDFGLARRVSGESTGITQSGDILGTPAYMAPEQADGLIRSISRQTDVYGLGATLYALMTGRAPHTGPTLYDVLQKVRHEDPAPPGGVKDLQAICLKALEKQSSRRYPSAGAMAADLDQFLNKRRVLAVGRSPVRRLKQAVVRRPAAWGLSALAGLTVLVAIVIIAIQASKTRAYEQTSLDAERKASEQTGKRASSEAVVRGVAYFYSGDPDSAHREFEVAVEWDPRNAQAYFYRALASHSRGYLFSAVSDFDVVSKLDPEGLLGRLSLGIAHYLNGKRDAARSQLGKVISEYPRNSLAHVFRGCARSETSDIEGAIRDFDKAASLGLSSFEGRMCAAAYVAHGQKLYEKGELQESITFFARAIRLAPNEPLAFNNRGMASFRQGDLDAAKSDFDRAIALAPNESLAFNNRGMASFRQGDLDAAKSDFDRAIAIDSKVASYYSNRVLVHNAEKNYSAALADSAHAIRLDPRDALAYNNRGLTKASTGDSKGAIEDFDQALILDSELAIAYQSRGNTRANLGENSRAIEDLEKFLELAPGSPDVAKVRTTLAELYRRVGRRDP